MAYTSAINCNRRYRGQTMKWLAIAVLLGLAVVYVLIGSFGFVMSAFCFDAGVQSEAWQCFTAINLIFVVPAAGCVIAGIVLLFRRRYKWAMAVAAIPAALAVLAFVGLSVANAVR